MNVRDISSLSDKQNTGQVKERQRDECFFSSFDCFVACLRIGYGSEVCFSFIFVWLVCLFIYLVLLIQGKISCSSPELFLEIAVLSFGKVVGFHLTALRFDSTTDVLLGIVHVLKPFLTAAFESRLIRLKLTKCGLAPL